MACFVTFRENFAVPNGKVRKRLITIKWIGKRDSKDAVMQWNVL